MKKIRPYLWRGGALVLAAALVVLLVLSGMGLSTQEPEPLPQPPAQTIRTEGQGGASQQEKPDAPEQPEDPEDEDTPEEPETPEQPDEEPPQEEPDAPEQPENPTDDPEQPEQPEPDGLSVDYAKEAAKELGSRLGRGCRIVTGRKKGRIELEYYGVEDLNQLLDALHALKTK